MSAKQIALQVISKLRDDVSWAELTDELYAAAVREGMDELDRGEGIPHDEVKRQFDS